MKKQIKLIVAMLLFGVVASFANQMPDNENRLVVHIEKAVGNATSLDLRLVNLQKKGTLILLQDVNGNNWYSQYVWRKVGYAKRLNLKGMPEGVYTLTVKHEDATVVQVLRLSKGGLEMSKQKQIEMPEEPGRDLVRKD